MAGLFAGGLLSIGCGATEVEAPINTLMIDSPRVTLRAARHYGPHTTWEDGEATLDQPIEFKVPRQLPVIQGNAGNHKARLSFRTASGEQVDCEYRGGSRDPHPDTELEYMLAQVYLFEKCSSGALANSVQQSSWFKLHVITGDQKDAANVTRIQVPLGQSFGTLEPPIPPAESIAIRDAFSWQNTQALPEINAEGLPTLYYTIVYVEERDQIEALNELGVHHDSLPLFSSELARWSGQRGIFDFEGDGTGLFLFALMPGTTYNLLRQAALEGDVIFRVIQPREVPPGVRASDGSVSYQALRDSGFRYLDQDPPPPSGISGENLKQQRQELFSHLRRRVAAIAAVVQAVVVGVQVGIGFVDRTVHGSVQMTVSFPVLNIDPTFPVGTTMVRTWGERAGDPVTLAGLTVTARQQVGPLPTKFLGNTTDEGVATFTVGRERDTSLCVATENAAAEITSFLVENQVCDFETIAAADLTTDAWFRRELRNRQFNLLAQATEGYSYMRDVLQLTPRKAIILVGRLANLASPRDFAVAPCFGFPNLAYDATVRVATSLVTALGAIGGGIGYEGYSAAKLAGIIYAVDIIVPDRTVTAALDSNLDSRGVLSHEYGHFALASMLYARHPANITVAYTEAIISRITNTGEDNEPPPTHESAYINEAFADFFAEQILGGKDYVQFGWSHPRLGIQYCDATNSCGCIDSHIVPAGTRPFLVPLTRIFALLHDAADGWPRFQQTPGDGAFWTGASAPLTFNSNPALTGSAGDENVRLTGWQIRQIIDQWHARGNLLREDSFLGGLAAVTRLSGYGWCDTCRLFALHDGRMAGGGAAQMQALCNTDPIRRWIGPMPAGTNCQLNCEDGNPCTQDTLVNSNTCTFTCARTPAPPTVVCRGADGVCDAAERCDGVSTACPADEVRHNGFECRSAAGVCDIPESCDGNSKACPVDRVASPGSVCRDSAGPCDQHETCNGTSNQCPADGFQAAGTVCRGVAGVCDAAETCSGTSAACPADSVKPAGTLCRAPTSACDPAETCGGTTVLCPTDVNTCQNSAAFSSGVADGFSTANGTESPSPSSGLRTFVRNNYAFAEIRDFDDARSNRFFAHTFSGLNRSGVSICGARLTFRVRSGDSNDAVVLGFVDAGGTLNPNRWTSALTELGVPVGGDKTLTLNVAALPQPSGTTVNLLPLMQSMGWLDMYVQDDSAVDFVTLEVDYCQ
jgi:hypothetical protein